MAIFVALFAVWATLVWSARLLLQESFLYFSLIGIMGLILIYVFVIFASHFKVLMQDFDSIFFTLETVLFATIPLLSSSILTWFLCVEIASFDISLSFAFCYFAFTLILCKPMKSSHQVSERIERHNSFVLCLPTILVVYLVPVVMCPLLYAATAHNVLFSSATHVIEHVTSILWPVVLMLFCAQKHYEYWPSASVRESSATIGTTIPKIPIIYSTNICYFDDNSHVLTSISICRELL